MSQVSSLATYVQYSYVIVTILYCSIYIPWHPSAEKLNHPFWHLSHCLPVTPGWQGEHTPPKAAQVEPFTDPVALQSQASGEKGMI